MTTYGNDSWTAPSNNNNNSKTQFLKLEDGKNKIRVLTDPFPYLSHGYKPDGAKYPSKVRCSMPGHDQCPLCEMVESFDDEAKQKELKAKKRWMFGVMSRKGEPEFKVLDVAWGIFSGIKALGQDEEWGDPKEYDITIIANKKATSPMDFYKVNPVGKAPLSAVEQKVRDEGDEEYIKRLTSCPSPEDVLKEMKKIEERAAKYAKTDDDDAPSQKAVAKKTSAPAKATKPVKQASDDADETDDEFPSYDN